MGQGRPSIYTEELAAEICRRIASGQSLRAICKEEGMPHRDTVLGWLFHKKHDGFSDQYAQALRFRAETYAEEIVDVSDEAEDHPVSRRVRVDARKWVVSKLLPRVYGDKVAVEHSGQIATKDLPATVDDARELLRAAGVEG